MKNLRFDIQASNINDFPESVDVSLNNNQIFVSAEHFRRQTDTDLIRNLLQISLQRVHVEVSAYCNRQCGFCPNSAGSRLQNQQLLPETIFLQILQDLKEIEYDKVFGFHQYNEPLANRIILTRISQARAYLPDALLSITSNGDYLDRDYLDSLEKAGLNRLYLSIYGPNNGEFIDSFIQNRMKAIAQKLDIPFITQREQVGQFYAQSATFRSLKIFMRAKNYWTSGYNRGELVDVVPDIKRTSPCFYPFQDITVDWRGNVLPCCNVYPDSPEHEKWITGNLNDGRSIFEHYADSKLVEWRRNLIRFFPKGSPCETCSRLEHVSLATSENVGAMNELADRLVPKDVEGF